MILPPGPVPFMLETSIPFSAAIFRASGDTLIRSPSEVVELAGAVAAGVATEVSGSADSPSSAGSGEALSEEAEEVSSPSSARTPNVVPTGTFCPASTRISVRTPSSKASISIDALSVSISAITSPISISSPTLTLQEIRVPSVMVSESFGISIFTDINF